MPILDQYGSPIASPRANPFKRVLAKYDAAQTSEENLRHWSWEDSLSADAANSPEVRRKLRQRSRYEVANNAYCRSMIETIAADVIGTTPRIQIRTGNRTTDAYIEREFTAWAFEIDLGRKLRTMRKAKAQDGEGIGLTTTKQRLPTPVKLHLRIIETEMLATPDRWIADRNSVDGVVFDEDGDPLRYHILREHPGGGDGFRMSVSEYDSYPASRVTHVFRADRPGQHRGIPETMPALRLFAQLRRYTLAVLAAAETAADFAAVVQTSQPPGTGFDTSTGLQAGNTEVESMDVFELAQRMVTVLPEGYQLGQIKAEQPTTTYGDFKREILGEAFAAMVMPYNVGAHDSSEFNYASGKLDRLTYSRTITIERSEWVRHCVWRLFLAWFDEAAMIPGYLPEGIPPITQWRWLVHWDGVEDIDPVKAANSAKTLVEAGLLSEADYQAGKGRDWEEHEAQRADELGVSVEEFRRLKREKLYGAPQAQQQPAGTDAG